MTEEEATKEAEYALSLMRIGKWKIHLWENIHWCWDLYSETGHVRIFSSHTDKYYCSLSLEPNGAGTPSYLFTGVCFKDPNMAVIAQIKELTRHTKTVSTVLAKVTAILRERK